MLTRICYKTLIYIETRLFTVFRGVLLPVLKIYYVKPSVSPVGATCLRCLGLKTMLPEAENYTFNNKSMWGCADKTEVILQPILHFFTGRQLDGAS